MFVIIILGIVAVPLYYFTLVKKYTLITQLLTTSSAFTTYTNNEYGFSIALPDSWNGYNEILGQWEARDVGSGDVIDHGPIFTLRHPKWTEENKREDMPIMIFTPLQWASVQSGNISLGAAPIPPSVLGKNSKYVITLPARYNYDYKTGFEEVDQLVHTLKSFEPK